MLADTAELPAGAGAGPLPVARIGDAASGSTEAGHAHAPSQAMVA